MTAWCERISKICKKVFSHNLKLWIKLTVGRNVVDKNKCDRCAVKCKHAVKTYCAQRELNMINSHDLGRLYKFVNNKLSSEKRYPSSQESMWQFDNWLH